MLQPKERPESLSGVTTRVRTGHGNLYVTVNLDAHATPFEVFAALGKAGGCDHAQGEALCRMVSMALRLGASVEMIVRQLRGITCCPFWDEGVQVMSVPDGISRVLEKYVSKELGKEPRGIDGDKKAGGSE